MDWIGIESTAYTIAFTGSFLALAVWESWRPLRAPSHATERRWMSHGVLFAAGALFQAVAVRVSPLLMALAAGAQPWGLLNRSWQPWPLRLIASILLLDFTRYWTHRLFHSLRVLWRIHEVHHSDPDYDVSTAARFHPLEVAGGKALYVLAIGLLAPPMLAVFIAELHTTLFNTLVHANVALPARLEPILRLVFVTPDLHRIHHSIDIDEQNSNFGQTFIWWDRMLGTYRASAHAAPEAFATGVADLPRRSYDGVVALFTAPFQERRE